jgi:predicted small secreted protein
MKKLLSTAVVTAAMAVSSGVWAACSADIDMGGNKITNAADPTAAQDVATKAYVDIAGGLGVFKDDDNIVSGQPVTFTETTDTNNDYTVGATGVNITNAGVYLVSADCNTQNYLGANSLTISVAGTEIGIDRRTGTAGQNPTAYARYVVTTPFAANAGDNVEAVCRSSISQVIASVDMRLVRLR